MARASPASSARTWSALLKTHTCAGGRRAVVSRRGAHWQSACWSPLAAWPPGVSSSIRRLGNMQARPAHVTPPPPPPTPTPHPRPPAFLLSPGCDASTCCTSRCRRRSRSASRSPQAATSAALALKLASPSVFSATPTTSLRQGWAACRWREPSASPPQPPCTGVGWMACARGGMSSAGAAAAGRDGSLGQTVVGQGPGAPRPPHPMGGTVCRPAAAAGWMACSCKRCGPCSRGMRRAGPLSQSGSGRVPRGGRGDAQGHQGQQRAAHQRDSRGRVLFLSCLAYNTWERRGRAPGLPAHLGASWKAI